MNPNPTTIGLDRRIVAAGLAVSVSELVAVFADHWPGNPPAPATCPGCGFGYPDRVVDCPTNQVVRRLLYRRRHVDQRALSVLTPDQFADLHHGKPIRNPRMAVRQPARLASRPCRTQSLFDLFGEDVTS